MCVDGRSLTNSTFWSSDSTYTTALSSFSLYKSKQASETTAFFAPQVLAHHLRLQELRIEKSKQRRDYGNCIDRYSSAVFARWRGLGIFSLAPVAPAGPLTCLRSPTPEQKTI